MTRRALVVGGDGLVGSDLVRRLQRAGFEVAASTRRKATVEPGRFYLDLADEPDRWPDLANPDVAVLCAGVVGFANCRAHPRAAAQVNVAGTGRLAERLAADGTRLVYFSSNAVFDGARPHVPLDSPTVPKTEYGRQKAAAERLILSCGGDALVVRLSKILTPALPSFADWAAGLRAGSAVEVPSDVRRAPLPLDFAGEMIVRAIERRLGGILQASGDEDVPNVDVARMLARAMAVDPRLVVPVRTAAEGAEVEDLRPHTTVDSRCVREELDLAVPSSRATIRQTIDAFLAANPAFRPAPQP